MGKREKMKKKKLSEKNIKRLIKDGKRKMKKESEK